MFQAISQLFDENFFFLYKIFGLSFFSKIFQNFFFIKNASEIDFLLSSLINVANSKELKLANFSSIGFKMAAWRPFFSPNWSKLPQIGS